MSTYDRLIAEGFQKGATIEKFQSAIEFILFNIIEVPRLSNKKIADFTGLEEVFIQEIRTLFKKKKLAKLNQVILKEFQKNGINNKAATSKLKALVEKYYLLFNNEEKL